MLDAVLDAAVLNAAVLNAAVLNAGMDAGSLVVHAIMENESEQGFCLRFRHDD